MRRSLRTTTRRKTGWKRRLESRGYPRSVCYHAFNVRGSQLQKPSVSWSPTIDFRTPNKLLHAENDGLTTALLARTQRTKQSKAMELYQDTCEQKAVHSGVLWVSQLPGSVRLRNKTKPIKQPWSFQRIPQSHYSYAVSTRSTSDTIS